MTMTTPTRDPSVQRPRRSIRRGLRAVYSAAAAAALAALVADPAQAEYANVTTQAVRAHADWLAWAPAPVGGPVAVCLVDTGVDTIGNPDTSSSVIAASPLDATGAPGDGGTTKHGTLMTQIMAAPLNGYGMVGVWPQLKIVDVRAVTPGANTFTYSNYQRAITRCQTANTGGVPIAAINLSLGGDPSLVTQEERDTLADVVVFAHNHGMNVVAAAGNAGVGVLAPGDYAGIFTVAAGDTSALCGFASRGREVDIAAPGCGLDQAFPDGSPAIDGWGSSQASAFTSAVIAALRAYKPSLTVAQAEAALTSTATPIAGGYSQLDVESAFESVGLSQLVADAKAAQAAGLATAPTGGGDMSGPGAPATGGGGGAATKASTLDPAPAPALEPTPAAPMSQPVSAGTDVVAVDEPIRTPKARPLRTAGGGMSLTLSNRPKDALAIVTVYAAPKGAKSAAAKARVVKRLRGITSRFVIDVDQWSRIEVVYRDGLSADSKPLIINAPRKAAVSRSAHKKSRHGR